VRELPLPFYLLNLFMTWKVLVVFVSQSVCLKVYSFDLDDFCTALAENGTDGCISEQYVCGECGENFLGKSDIKSHMFTKHMCKYKAFALRYIRVFLLTADCQQQC